MQTSNINAAAASDIRTDHWILRIAPVSWRPYLRLIRADRPIGTWLLLIPCLWSVTMASDVAGLGVPSPWYIALFAIGSFVMRGAGCVINDLWDRDIDARVARTATRPIASGEISIKAGLIFLISLLLVGLVVLLQFNMSAIMLGVASLGLVATYPLMKRVTYWPQAFLGLTFNWGALLAWAAVQGSVGEVALMIYVAGIFWTLSYDTIYGHQDKEDDIHVGVKSSSIKLGDKTKPFVMAMYAGTVMLLGTAGHFVGMNWFYFAALSVVAVQFIWQVRTLDIDDPDNCLARFKSNRDAGLIIFIGCLLG
jgi:4-hydroxybenzoate polyprenyltransferase